MNVIIILPSLNVTKTASKTIVYHVSIDTVDPQRQEIIIRDGTGSGGAVTFLDLIAGINEDAKARDDFLRRYSWRGLDKAEMVDGVVHFFLEAIIPCGY